MGQFIGSDSDGILLCDRKPWLEGHVSLKFMKIKEIEKIFQASMCL